MTWTATDSSGNSSTCDQKVGVSYAFTGFWDNDTFVGDHDPDYLIGSKNTRFGFKVADPQGNAITSTSVIASYGWDLSGATTGTPTYNSRTQMFEITTTTPGSWPPEPRSFTVRLTDGSIWTLTAGRCSGPCT